MKIKACPFCGWNNPRLTVIMGRDGKTIVGWKMTCEPDDYPCGAQGPILDKRLQAKKAWQKRASK